MNKILKLLAAATLIALTTAACQKEQLSDNSAEGAESVTFTVQTEVGTKAVADEDGLAAKIDQVLVAVYMKDGDTFRLYDEPVATYTASNKQATFSVNLIRKQTYQIVVWAQKEGAYVCTEGLQSIVRSSAKASVCNDDELDAFYASHEYVQGSPSASTSIQAKRPFAQLNLITKDLRTDFEPSNVTVTYVSDTKFNALTGLSSEPAATAVTYSATQPNYKAQGKTLDAAKNTLVMNYLFAPETEQIVLPSVKMTAKLTEVVDFEVSNVPAKRNYRTNVIGNLLTEQTDFTITVVPEWETPELVGPVPGYMGAVLPEAPVVSGNVMTVNTENAQYALDGAYGSIDGMTIKFSAGTYPQLIFGRPNKYPGSNTIYRHGNFGNAPMSYEDFVAYKSQSGCTEGCMYERIISNVTFTAENGAVLTGMSYNAGAHIYGSAESPVYDYVLDKGTLTVGSCYYHKLVASNIVYEGITFQKVADYRPLDISSSSAISVIDGVTVSHCNFIGTGTASTVGQAIRFYTENQSGAAGTEGKVVRNLVVKNTTIDNFHQGIYTNGAYGVTVEGCTISNTGHNAIALQSISAAVNLGQVNILSNTFTNIGDRIIRIGNVAAGSSFSISGNVATNSGDAHGEVLKAGTLASGLSYDIHENNWGEGKTVVDPEFTDQPAD